MFSIWKHWLSIFLFIFVLKNYSTFCIFTLPYYLLSKIVALQNQTQVQLRFRNMVKIHTLAFPKYPEPEQGGKGLVRNTCFNMFTHHTTSTYTKLVPRSISVHCIFCSIELNHLIQYPVSKFKAIVKIIQYTYRSTHSASYRKGWHPTGRERIVKKQMKWNTNITFNQLSST